MIDDNDNDSDDVGLTSAHRALLDGLEGPPLSRAVEDRLRQRVLASVGVGIAAGALASTSASAASMSTASAASTASSAAVVATKATLGAVVAKSVAGVIGAAVIVGGVTIATTAPKTTPTTTTTTTTTTTAPPAIAPKATHATNDEGTAGDTEPVAATTGTTMPTAETPPPASMSPPPPVTVSKRKTSLEVAVTPPVAEPPVDEVTLLDRARRALAANDPARALALVETAATQTPSSSFAEERTALQVLALAGVGRRDEAAALAQRFFAQWPDSLLASRVRAALR